VDHKHEAYVDALKVERQYCMHFGVHDRIPDIDAELARLGSPVVHTADATPDVETAAMPRKKAR